MGALKLELPTLVTFKARHEGRHRLVRRPRLHLIVIASGLLLTPLAEEEDARSLLLRVGSLLLLDCILYNLCPTFWVLNQRSGIHERISTHCRHELAIAIQVDGPIAIEIQEHRVIP